MISSGCVNTDVKDAVLKRYGGLGFGKGGNLLEDEDISFRCLKYEKGT